MALPGVSATNNSLSGLNSALSRATSIVDWAKSNYPPAPLQKTDTTWYRSDNIAWQNWNQFFPIQLMVVENNEGLYSQRTSDGNWSWVAPVGVEGLSIGMPFASANTITLGGDITEHNGAPSRMISLSGTFGVIFGKQAGPPPPTLSFANAIFAGTLNNLSNTATIANSILSPPNFQTNVIPQETFEDPTSNGLITGYAQMRLLVKFFEEFNELKKTDTGKNSRLALAIWKQEAVYLVTPVGELTIQQTSASPLEYLWNLNFKATKRVKLAGSSAGAIQPYVSVMNNPDKLTKMLNTIEAARATLQSAKQTIQAIGGDIDANLFTPLREVTLLAKDALSVPFAVADMANNVINSMKGAILDLANTKNAVVNFKSNIKQAFGTVTKNASTISFNLNQLAAEQNGDPNTVPGAQAAPANNPFIDPPSNYDFFSGIKVGDLNLSPPVLTAVANERQRVKSLTRLDFEKKRNAIQQISDNYANAVGAGASTYNSVYGVTTPINSISDSPTDDDFNVLFTLNSVIMEFNKLVVSTTTNTNNKQDTISSVAGMATQAGIAFQVPISKFAIPFPFGATIENLASKYLGDPDRAIEIITLNGLQNPYVDEEGFTYPLTSNGAGNILFLATAVNLYVGQPVWVSSSTTKRIKTRISGLKVNNDQIMVIVEDDVSLYTTVAKAELLAYLPNTVNSQQTIYIPSQVESEQNDLTIRAVPGINQYDPLLAIAGIDFLLNQNGDIIIDKNGDNKWATGLTSIIQWATIALKTKAGALNRHPSYGVNLQPGTSLANLTATEVIQSIRDMFALNPAFSGLAAASVTINGPVSDLNLALTLSNTNNQFIPVSMQVLK